MQLRGKIKTLTQAGEWAVVSLLIDGRERGEITVCRWEWSALSGRDGNDWRVGDNVLLTEHRRIT